MKATHKAHILLAVVLLVSVAFVVLKLTVPMSYAEAAIRPEAVEHVINLQQSGPISAQHCAARYCYYKTDFHIKNPKYIRITERQMASGRVRVKLYNPNVQCDSTSESIYRVELEKESDGTWIPVRLEWAHKGRGRFGWTTKPTT